MEIGLRASWFIFFNNHLNTKTTIVCVMTNQQIGWRFGSLTIFLELKSPTTWGSP
jgi:hypothetical protein